MSLKLLHFDIETSPMRAYVWGRYDQTIHSPMVIDESFIMCFCAKWHDKKKVISHAIPDYRDVKGVYNSMDDKEVVQELWELLDQADIVVAHNAKRFDVKVANAHFLKHGMTPPSPYKVVDTLLVARSNFKLSSNRLDDLGTFLKVGRKVETGGFKLWKDCLESGKQKPWNDMVKYCKQDVLLLEKVYNKLLPWIKNHPNYAVFTDESRPVCPNCGSHNVQSRGKSVAVSAVYQRFHCQDCGKWSRERVSTLDTNKPKLVNIGV